MSTWGVVNKVRERLGLKRSESRWWLEGMMAIVRAITDQQRRLGLGCGLVSLAQVGPLGFRGEQRGENGSILFDI